MKYGLSDRQRAVLDILKQMADKDRKVSVPMHRIAEILGIPGNHPARVKEAIFSLIIKGFLTREPHRDYGAANTYVLQDLAYTFKG